MKTLGLPAGAGVPTAKAASASAKAPKQQKKQHHQQPSSHRPFVVPSLSAQPKAAAPQKPASVAPSSSSSSSSSSSVPAPVALPKKIHHVDKHGKLTSNKPLAPPPPPSTLKTAANGKAGPPAKGKAPTAPPPRLVPVQKDVKRKWWVAPVGDKGAAAEQLVAAPAEDGAWYALSQPGLVTVEAVEAAAEGGDSGVGGGNALATVDDKTLTDVVAAVGAAYARECTAYQQAKRGRPSADRKWINDVLEAGTVSDKVAALALTVQVRLQSQRP